MYKSTFKASLAHLNNDKILDANRLNPILFQKSANSAMILPKTNIIYI